MTKDVIHVSAVSSFLAWSESGRKSDKRGLQLCYNIPDSETQSDPELQNFLYHRKLPQRSIKTQHKTAV